jgi:RNA polymerase subunit RPABC4/transcription elongation factor Spt4
MTPAANGHTVIPLPAAIVAAVLAVASFAGMSFVFMRAGNVPAIALLVQIAVPLLVAGYVLVVGYIYGDARRRGMRYVMWTLLAIFIPNGIGIILYFILRDPMPVYCSSCGRAMQPGFAYCPGCGANFLAACRSCGRTLQSGWSHCAWCGQRV